MRLPNRKPGKYTFPQFDHQITQVQLEEMQAKLRYVKEVKLPRAITETKTYAANGDFSENAEYQIAKGRLRGLLRTIDELQYQITHAVIIQPPTDTAMVQIGHAVTVRVAGQAQQLTILGSSESDPAAGVISYQSPVGAALLGHAVGDQVTINLGDRAVVYEIVKITLS